MRISKYLVRLSASLLAAGLCFGQAPPDRTKKTPAQKEIKSLIRKGLLRVQKKELALPLRNIFAPQSAASSLAGTALPAETENAGANEPAEEVQAAPVFNINLRYVGFIAGKKLTALIILDGRAMAVEEGEVVGEGLRVAKITQTQVEITLPDSSTRTFSLEGEGG
ncbi:MAG: hypothetical protein AB1715_12455 [Acidobacteriota bacterium]